MRSVGNRPEQYGTPKELVHNSGELTRAHPMKSGNHQKENGTSICFRSRRTLLASIKNTFNKQKLEHHKQKQNTHKQTHTHINTFTKSMTPVNKTLKA